MNRCIRIVAAIVLLGLLLLTVTSCGAPDNNPWHKSKAIYISDMPSGDQLFISLENMQWGDPVRCHFGAKVSAQEILDLIELKTGIPVKTSVFESSDGVKGYLLEIPGEHTVFQNFFDTGRDYHKKGLMEYEMQGCDVMLVPNGDTELEAAIMFPLVVLDTPYHDYSFYSEQLLTDKPYKLIEKDINGKIISYQDLLGEFYDKLECYSVERISEEELLVTADEDLIKGLYNLHNGNSPSRSFYLGQFIIRVRDGAAYFYTESGQ